MSIGKNLVIHSYCLLVCRIWYNVCMVSFSDKFELVFIFVSVICGVISATYFYQSTEIFTSLLKRPLRMISSGMIVMSLGVLLAAFISYEAKMGLKFSFYGIPFEAFFYGMYIIGSIFILLGARKLVSKPKLSV